jgi:RNA polymerase sigma factor (sigma-70 family)
MTAAHSGDMAGSAVQLPEARLASAELARLQAARDADCALIALYAAHYRSLVHLAELLVGDLAVAEEVVQESFVAMHGCWRRLRYRAALSYLRRSVINRSRCVRHHVVVDRNARQPLPDGPGAEQAVAGPGAEQAMAEPLERSAVIAALGSLPPRQREVVVLRYYGDCSETQVAAAMGISKTAVKRYTALARTALRTVLERRE